MVSLAIERTERPDTRPIAITDAIDRIHIEESSGIPCAVLAAGNTALEVDRVASLVAVT
jgi:hypothetical protein